MGLSVSSLEICLPGQLMFSAARACKSNGAMAEHTYLHLGVGPAGHLNNHVEDRLLLVGIQGNVVPWRDELSVLLNEDTVLERVGRANPAGCVGHDG
jgi:hypothetical protein